VISDILTISSSTTLYFEEFFAGVMENIYTNIKIVLFRQSMT